MGGGQLPPTSLGANPIFNHRMEEDSENILCEGIQENQNKKEIFEAN